MEDINGILNTGDLPNLYQLEDKATIMENMANVAKQLVSVKRKSECCRPRSKNWANRALTVMEIWLLIQIRIMGNHLVIFRNILFGLNIKQSVIQLIKFI